MKEGAVSYFRVLRLPFLGDIQVDISKPTSLDLIFHTYLPEYKQQLTLDSVLQAQTLHIQRRYRWLHTYLFRVNTAARVAENIRHQLS